MPDWPALAARVQQAGQTVLGESVTYEPSGLGQTLSLRALFSEAAVRAELADGVAVETRRPVLSVHVADLPQAPRRGDRVTVRSVAYQVVAIEADGEGDADLLLERRP